MNQQERNEAVLEWIQSGCNYGQGVQLYSQFGKNNFLRIDFIEKQYKYSTKIIYELCKSASLDFAQLQTEKLIPVLQETPIVELPSSASHSGDTTSTNTTVPELVEGIAETMEVNNIAEPGVTKNIKCSRIHVKKMFDFD